MKAMEDTRGWFVTFVFPGTNPVKRRGMKRPIRESTRVGRRSDIESRVIITHCVGNKTQKVKKAMKKSA